MAPDAPVEPRSPRGASGPGCRRTYSPQVETRTYASGPIFGGWWRKPLAHELSFALLATGSVEILFDQ